MLGQRRGSTISLAPPLSPISALQRPTSAADQASIRHVRTNSDVTIHGEAESRNVRVVLRIKPSDPDDNSVPPRFRSTLVHPTSSSDIRVDVDPATPAGGVSQAGSSKRHPTFTFDHVLGEESTQVDLYDASAGAVVDEYLKGHNVTFLAYGQTSSGKSYSMGTTGEDADYNGTDFNARTGLIPRTVQTIFEKAEETRLAAGIGSTWECRLSFLELYNEEIIDLLSGSGVTISIREEKDGRIIWSGVREVRVKSLDEVMHLLQEGSTRRKTGETNMNATSSRSHAIFSLTLVQKKRLGSNTNPPNSTAIPTSASQPIRSETPTRQLRRPTSMTGFPARSPTPSGGRGLPPSAFSAKGSNGPMGGMSRPNSVIGIAESEFLVVTSKFNMVDLAGSERLKRTAAQGERMREGISINSGLLALGNVISTLCEPAKSRGHIPYRDSKLTRMLQDSIGGNALTTMIACVSGIEYNITETLNTIKYASRARNIKNSAKINAVEAGWDDVEHLQNTVIKLRKQMASLDGERGAVANEVGGGRGSDKLIARLAELQREHTELYDRYLQKCSDNMRLTSELRNARPGDGDALAKFNETVEPVILEYEKVVSALNKQLDELRSELNAVNDLYEEQGKQLADSRDMQTQSESYVAELRNRVNKLSERNRSGEAYIHDLEAKLKLHSDKGDSHSGLVADLRKEMAKIVEGNVQLTQHAGELEARLAKSEASSATLISQIEKHEKEAERRDAAFKDLESHIAVLDTTQDNKLLLEELEGKDKRIAELTRVKEEVVSEFTEEKAKLAGAVEAERAVQVELRAQLARLQRPTSTPVKYNEVPVPFEVVKESSRSRSPIIAHKELTPPDSPSSGRQQPTTPDDDVVLQLRAALRLLAARCNEAETRYTEAETKLVDLNTQLSEAKLIHAEMDDVVPLSPALPSPSNGDETSENGSTLQTPKGSSLALSPVERKMGGGKRSSLPIITGGMKPRDFRTGRGYGEIKGVRPQSLSQELSSAQSSATSPRTSWGGHSSLLFASSPTRLSLPPMQRPLRSSQSLEAELKFVHRIVEERDEELKDRESYIRQLEDTLQQSHLIPSRKTSAHSLNIIPGLSPRPTDIPLPPSPSTSSFQIIAPQTPRGSLDKLKPPIVVNLSPKSAKRFSALKDSLSRLEKGGRDVDETQSRVDDLMREMAVKEASQREIIEQQFIQIADLQKANNRFREEIYGQDQPRSVGLGKSRSDTGYFSYTPHETPSTAKSESSSTVNRLREEHAEELQSVLNDHAQIIDNMKTEHETAMRDVRSTLEATLSNHRSFLDTQESAHATRVSELEETHKAATKALADENEMIAEEMEKSLAESEETRRQLKMKSDQALFELSRIRDEYQIQHNGDIKRLAELEKAKIQLERVKGELEGANADLTKRISELESRTSRKSILPPPQGPPPNTPLPPLPPTFSASRLAGQGQGETTSSSGHSAAQHVVTGGSAGDVNGVADITAAVAGLPEPVGVMVKKVVEERDGAVMERDALKQQVVTGKERIKESELKLQEEKAKCNNVERDLHDARKTNSKLRAHLEETRQETQRVTEACKDHMTELNERRSKMTKFSEESGHNRDSLLAANAQVVNLKAQLDRAVEKKVNKKLLRCF